MFDAHHRDIHGYCLRRLPVDDANEATSEVFLTAWRRYNAIPAGDAALPWLYGVARNTVRNYQRSERRRIRLAVRTGSLARATQDGPDVIVVRNAEHERVIAAMATLRERDREILALKIWENLTNEQVGTVVGITHRAVEGRYTRALKKLAKHLGPSTSTVHGSPFSPERGEAII